jgi:hypothetical protein
MEAIDLRIKGLKLDAPIESIEKIIREIIPNASFNVDAEFEILTVKGDGAIRHTQDMINALIENGLTVEVPAKFDTCSRSPYCNCGANG